METEDVRFRSDGLQLAGTLVLPDGDGPFPAAALCGGWLYVKEMNLPVYAERAAERGIATLRFDFRNFGESEGEPRLHINPWEQIEDLRCGLSRLEADPRIDGEHLGVWGISYGGGHALITGAIDARARCVVATVPAIDNFESQRRVHGQIGFRKLQQALLDDRRNRFATGEHSYHSFAGSDQEVATIPGEEMRILYEGIKETIAPNYEGRSTLASDEWLLNYSVYPYVRRLIETPTLMVITENDDVSYGDLQTQAFNDIPTVRKKLVNLPNTSRIELYRDATPIERMAELGADWLAEHLGAEPA